MTNAIATRDVQTGMIEQVLISGDLKNLTPAQRIDYYQKVCNSLGLNPLTKPFDYISLNGKLVLYAKRDCTDQLRKIYNVSVNITDRARIEDVYVVTARATMSGGRVDESTGAVALGNLKGEALANALMKAETKAKRRVTMSIVGLGWLDETEVETIPGARAESMGNAHPIEVTAPRPANGNGNGHSDPPKWEQANRRNYSPAAPSDEPVADDEPEQPLLETKLPTSNQPTEEKFAPAKMKVRAEIKEWNAGCAELAQRFPKYAQPNGGPNMFHILGAAAKCGFAVVDDSNYEDAISAMLDRAAEALPA